MPVTVVPGGGPFADAVRATQSPMGFSDEAGHKMAMLGMEQYGLALVDKFAGLDLASTPDEASAVHAHGKIALWRPSLMAIAANVDASWNVTSDSLAAFYAHASGSVTLAIIKSVDMETAPDLQGSWTPVSPPTHAVSTSLSQALRRLNLRRKYSREAAWPAFVLILLSCHERLNHEESSDASLGLGVDRIRSFFHGMSRYDPHTRPRGSLRQQGRGGSRAHV